MFPCEVPRSADIFCQQLILIKGWCIQNPQPDYWPVHCLFRMKGERKPGQKAETACSMPSLVYATWHGDPGTSRTSENANRKTRDSYVAAQGSMATIATRNVSRDLAPLEARTSTHPRDLAVRLE